MMAYRYQVTEEELQALKDGPGCACIGTHYFQQVKEVPKPRGMKKPPEGRVAAMSHGYLQGLYERGVQIIPTFGIIRGEGGPKMIYHFWVSERQDEEWLAIIDQDQWARWCAACTKPIGRARVGYVKKMMKEGHKLDEAMLLAAKAHPYPWMPSFPESQPDRYVDPIIIGGEAVPCQ